MVNKNKNIGKKEGGFKFGRNLASFLIIILGLGLLFLLVVIPYTYITESAKNKANVFEQEDVYTEYMSKYDAYKENGGIIKYEKPQRVKAKDFDLFDLKLEAKNYTQDAGGDDHLGQVIFDLSIKWNEKTSSHTENHPLNSLPTSTYSNINTKVGLASDWVKFTGYSYSKSLKVENKETATFGNSYTIDNVPQYPLYANTWPIKVKVPSPTAYVFLTFSYSASKGTVNEAYIVEFSYDEYMTNDTIGAIPNK